MKRRGEDELKRRDAAEIAVEQAGYKRQEEAAEKARIAKIQKYDALRAEQVCCYGQTHAYIIAHAYMPYAFMPHVYMPWSNERFVLVR